ncbi:hypothetical protein PMAYCL1PPCAC_15869, partial [Pristionchus mayeri]
LASDANLARSLERLVHVLVGRHGLGHSLRLIFLGRGLPLEFPRLDLALGHVVVDGRVLELLIIFLRQFLCLG